MTEVALQFGEVWPLEQSFTLVASKTTPPVVVSLARTVFTCAVFNGPELVSFTATGATGAETVGVYVELALCPRESLIW